PQALEGGFSPGYRPGLHEQQHPAPQAPSGSRYRHLAVSLVSSFVVLVLLAVIAVHGYIAWTLAHPYVAPLGSNPKLAKNLDYEDISFASMSGRTVVDGWYIPSTQHSSRTVVFSHGYGANREETWVPMYDLANLLHGLRYNVLMF